MIRPKVLLLCDDKIEHFSLESPCVPWEVVTIFDATTFCALVRNKEITAGFIYKILGRYDESLLGSFLEPKSFPCATAKRNLKDGGGIS